jgi:hypothetical protein
MIVIRNAEDGDFEAIWRIFQRVVAKGNSYVFSLAATQDEARSHWMSADFKTFVAVFSMW